MRGKNRSTHGLGVVDAGNESLGGKGCSRSAEQWHYSRSIWKAGSPGTMTNEGELPQGCLSIFWSELLVDGAWLVRSTLERRCRVK